MPLVLPGQETAINEPGSRFDRHHHLNAYAAILISGTCDEAGDRGRFQARPGDVLVHRAFDAHRDCIGRSGAIFINFSLAVPLDARFGRLVDLDAVVRLFARDAVEATALFRHQFVPVEDRADDWPDLLALDLADECPWPIERWARCHGMHPASVSRGFRLAFGVSPKRYRLEQLASRAARRIRAGRETLGAVAADCGFADQAHMTRTIVSLFGRTPRELRALG